MLGLCLWLVLMDRGYLCPLVGKFIVPVGELEEAEQAADKLENWLNNLKI